MMFVLLALLELTGALPFVTTWRTTQANEAIVLPPIDTRTAVTINWGDGTPNSNLAAGQNSLYVNHTYASAGLHNVSMDGQIFWTQVDSTTTKEKLVDISSWGDGFLVQYDYFLFANYPNLQVSASDSQPKFLAGALLYAMFQNSSFNSPLNWDLTNVTSLPYMFAQTPLNQPINFRNTQGVKTTTGMFKDTPYFNQPFHFDASGLTDANAMFYNASSFNQVVNLTNSSLLKDTSYMFISAVSFNQPIAFNTRSVTTMEGMFYGATNFNRPVNFNTSSVTKMQWMFSDATNFNQPVNFDTKSVITMQSMFGDAKKFNRPVNFNTSQVTDMSSMFGQAESFNQPINFDAPKLTTTGNMFYGASSFNQPVVMNAPNVTSLDGMFYNAVNFSSTVNFTSTAKVTSMRSMFYGANGFTQDLSSWNTQGVSQCGNFCDWCGLPAFPFCQPCFRFVRYTVGQMSVCSTLAPTLAYQPSAPSRAPSPAGGVAPSVDPSNSSSVSAATTATAAPAALTWALVSLVVGLNTGAILFN